jgi:hypothetical protein
MQKKFNLFSVLFVAIVFGAGFNSVKAQTADTSLFKQIAWEDSILFNAFNTRNIEQFKKMFSQDLEFYHDKGGITNYEHTIKFLETLTEEKSDLKRYLLKETLEVYPVPGYGAMEIGQHRFVHTENGKQEIAIFKFVQIWQQRDSLWQVSRVVSYGH